MADHFVMGGDVAGSALAEGRPPDWQERERALDVTRSWIVEAPAGSGKTGLLIQRYLKLLGDESVTEPEQVLAITFTVKAAAEIRERVMEQLEAARRGLPMKRGAAFERETRVLAAKVLERDALGGWGLLESPRRLKLRTIDSVCAQIAGSLPVLSGGGGQQTPVLDASGLYKAAARRTLLLLGGEDDALNAALRNVLLHRDGNLAECEKLLAEMLELRDQWGELVPLQRRELDDAYLDGTVLPRLERTLQLAVGAEMSRLAKAVPAHFLRELVALAATLGGIEPYEREQNPLAVCLNSMLPGSSGKEAHLKWRALIHLMVTPSGGGWRRGFAKNSMGFETTPAQKKQMKAVLEQVADRDDLIAIFKDFNTLPPAEYPEEQWLVAKALFRMLSRALVELQLVFAERGECDFAEVGLRAREALRSEGGVSDLEMALGLKWQHLLVDEMQDTSTSQYELIERLTQSWDGQSQTVFLVGDPKQSIYIFRQARVERFLRTMLEERLGDLRLGCLRLTANFRSQGGLVDAFNGDFRRMFPSDAEKEHPEEVTYTKADAVRGRSDGAQGAVWHCAVMAAGLSAKDAAHDKRQQRKDEAEAVREIISDWRRRPLPVGQTEPWKIAVLVRGRNYLPGIVAALKREDGDGAIPFRAVDIERLHEQQEVLDLTALTRALLHPADRVAWFALLRAPWCGLGLADLHRLAGEDDPTFAEWCVAELMRERGHLLSDDGCARLTRFWTVMAEAAKLRGRVTTAQWVERTWRTLGGDVSLTASALENARRYFKLLDEIERDGSAVDMTVLGQRLEHLYAEAAVIPGAVDLMTIHGAKGLEWDVVLVPGIERRSPPTRSRLLAWNEFDQRDADAAMVVLAPIAGKGEDSRELNVWLNRIQSDREAAERKRLFYVVCTRAREELHLFASPGLKLDGEVSRAFGSLLGAAWPAAERHFVGIEAATKPAKVVTIPGREETYVGDMAAGGSEPLRVTTLPRLPLSFDAKESFGALVRLPRGEGDEDVRSTRFERPEGSFAARAFGNTVHGFLELLTMRLTAGDSLEALVDAVPSWLPRIEAVLSGDGLPPSMVQHEGKRVLTALLHALGDEDGRWLLTAQDGAVSEYGFTTWEERRRSYRLDRMFRGGAVPRDGGEGCVWIVDYKTTSHGREGVDEFLAREREKYGAQMEAYARAFAGVHELRLALYYPMLPRLVWWKPELG